MDPHVSTTAIVLCGGLGTRLRPVVGALPKVLAPIAGRPFLDHLLRVLRGQGLSDVVLATGHGAGEVAEYGGNGSAWDVRLRYSVESEPLGTGGAVKHAQPLGLSDPFLVLNGDSMVRADLPAAVAFHRERCAQLTLVLTEVPDKARFGSVLLGPDGAVEGFVEKGHAGPGLINAGIYVVSRPVLDAIPSGRNVSIERDVFPALVGKGLYGVVAPGPFVDIGTPQSFEYAQTLFGGVWECGSVGVPDTHTLTAPYPHTPTLPHSPGERLVLLDRDGTINVEKVYLSAPEQIELLPGAAEGLRRLRRMGLPVAVVTNQSALARGYFDEATLERIHQRLRDLLAGEDASLDAIYTCPHLPDAGCDCRKPAPGLARRAAEAFGADLSRSFVIGDKVCDIALGQSVGATTLLVRTGYGREVEAQGGGGADYVVDDLVEAARVIAGLLEEGLP